MITLVPKPTKLQLLESGMVAKVDSGVRSYLLKIPGIPSTLSRNKHKMHAIMKN